MPPTAIVMNMFYTGLGIARSLGEQGIPVVGLSSHRGIYGNYTRYASVRECPDSREAPEQLLPCLLSLGNELGGHSVIFTTSDDDVLFLDRYRRELSEHFLPVIPPHSPLEASLDKWETFVSAQRAGVSVPKSWKVESESDLTAILQEIQFPCVLKPISAHHWRKDGKWQAVGGRKAIPISSTEELFSEYRRVASVEGRVLIQEVVSGGDDALFVAALYLDSASKVLGGFTARKVMQIPEGFGTGLIVETVSRPDLFETARHLLQSIQFSGIAEVEFKRDSRSGEYKLIEVNPRPWDQHRLGRAAGVDLIYLAYCDKAGLPLPQPTAGPVQQQKWVAEDGLVLNACRMLWRRDRRFLTLLRSLRGRRTYAIASLRDPMPLLGFMTRKFVPELISTFLRYLGSSIGASLAVYRSGKGSGYEDQLQNAKYKN